MGVDVPDGSAPVVQQPTKPAQAKIEKPKDNKKWATIGFIGVVSLLCVGALLVGFVPDWSSENEKLMLSSPSSADSADSGDSSIAQQYYVSNNGPFNIKIPLFSPNITDGYVSLDEAKQDIEQLAKFLLNDAIMSNSHCGWYRDPIAEEGGESDEDLSFNQGAAPVSPPASGTSDGATEGMAESNPDSGAADDDLENANDFDTNNQEENVDRGDLAKSDGKLIFTAYGHFLLVILAETGEEVARVEIPPIELPQGEGSFNHGYPDGTMEEPFMQPGFNDVAMPPYWNPKPNIDAILLEGNRLALVSSGYGIEYVPPIGALVQSPVLWDYQNTKLHLYDINDGDIAYVTSKSLNGSFRNAFSSEDSGYIVTQSEINTWDYLLGPIQCWQNKLAGLDDQDYFELAMSIAEVEVIPNFVASVLGALQAAGPVQLTRLSMYADSVSFDGEAELSLFSGGIANAITHVAAFDMSESIGQESDLTVKTAATFQPGNWGHVYAHKQMIIVADQGWHWSEVDQSSGDMTYLLGFRLDGPTATHSVVGSVPGHILSPYSLDLVEVQGQRYLRVATTQNFWRRWGEDLAAEDAASEGDGSDIDDFDVVDSEQSGSSSSTGVATLDPDMAAEGDGEGNDNGSEEEEGESSTLNQIFVLRFPLNLDLEIDQDSENELVLVGQDKMGKPNEVSRNKDSTT